MFWILVITDKQTLLTKKVEIIIVVSGLQYIFKIFLEAIESHKLSRPAILNETSELVSTSRNSLKMGTVHLKAAQHRPISGMLLRSCVKYQDEEKRVLFYLTTERIKYEKAGACDHRSVKSSQAPPAHLQLWATRNSCSLEVLLLNPMWQPWFIAHITLQPPTLISNITSSDIANLGEDNAPTAES